MLNLLDLGSEESVWRGRCLTELGSETEQSHHSSRSYVIRTLYRKANILEDVKQWQIAPQIFKRSNDDLLENGSGDPQSAISEGFATIFANP